MQIITWGTQKSFVPWQTLLQFLSRFFLFKSPLLHLKQKQANIYTSYKVGSVFVSSLKRPTQRILCFECTFPDYSLLFNSLQNTVCNLLIVQISDRQFQWLPVETLPSPRRQRKHGFPPDEARLRRGLFSISWSLYAKQCHQLSKACNPANRRMGKRNERTISFQISPRLKHIAGNMPFETIFMAPEFFLHD